MKSEDVPQVIQTAATEHAERFLGMAPCYPEQFELVDAFARAIMAAKAEEREACAKVAEQVGIPMVTQRPQLRVMMVPVEIASAIRSRT